MNVNEHSYNMNEVPNGIILYRDNDRVEELNQRIHGRVIPDSNVILNPNFDIRSVPTRNSLTFPIIDLKVSSKNSKKNFYDIEENFAPIQTKGPFVNFVNNVDNESQLRNQFYALQRGVGQSVFIPSSNSDLYNNIVPKSSVNVEQPFRGLFERSRNLMTTHNEFLLNPNIGQDVFHNNTKVQLRTTTKDYR